MGSFIQRHFANLRHIRDVFRIDPRVGRGTGQIAPWLSGVVQLVHPAFPGAFQFSVPTVRSFANPAVGANFLITIPPNEAWLLRSVRFTLTTDANAANRRATIQLNDSVNTFFAIDGVVTQPASTVRNNNYGKGFPYATSLTAEFIMALPDVVMAEGWRIVSAVSSIQVGDQISNLVVLIDVFPS